MWRTLVIWIAVGSSAAYVALAAVALSSGFGSPSAVLWLVSSGPPMVITAAYLLWRRPANPLGVLMMATALGTVVLPTVLEIPTVMRFLGGGPEPWMWAPMWASLTLLTLGTTAGAAMLALLPDGHVRYRHERIFLPIGLALAVLPTFALITNESVQLATFQFPGVRGIASPWYVPALAGLGPAVTAAMLLSGLVVVVGIWALLVRYRRTTAREQRQLRWVLLAGVLAVLLNVVPIGLGQLGVVPELQHDLVGFVTFVPALLVPLSVVAAVLEPSWIDVDWVIRRSLVYAVLSALILTIYVMGSAVIGLTAGSELPIELAIVVTVIVAVALQPVRSRLQRWADRRVFGPRPTATEAIARFGASVDDVMDASDLVDQLAASAGQALRLEWATASVAGVGERTVGERRDPPALTVDIRHRDEFIGRLECGRPIDGTFTPEDVDLVKALSGQAGLAISNARLVGRIVEAQEEERRRIERDLHDGAQQELIALVARLGLIRARLEAGTLDASAIDEAQAAVRRILTDIRELAQGIHPSIVTDGGIVAAVEERCARLPIDVTLDAQAGLRRTRFPSQIEGAAYFLVAEALANVLKHARATRATVALSRANGRLSVSVSDDGAGFDLVATRRRGLSGLEDRITALGGTMQVVSRPGAGTRIAATLPVPP